MIETVTVPGASLDYVKKEDGFLVELILSRLPGRGKAVVKEFVRKIGKNKAVYGDVVEKSSRQTLRELGYLDQVDKTGSDISITDESVLSKVKIVRVLNGGGVHVSRLKLEFIPDLTAEDFEVEFTDGKRVGIDFFGNT